MLRKQTLVIVAILSMTFLYWMNFHLMRPTIMHPPATPRVDRTASILRRMQYWKQSSDEPVTRLTTNMAAKTRYFVFQTWQGGFNNERMSLEIAFVLCVLTQRTLVLPPKYPLYLLDTSELTDYFSKEALLASGVPIISFSEFVTSVLHLPWPESDVIPHSHPLWGQMAAHDDVVTHNDLSIAGTDQGQQCWVYPSVERLSAADRARADGWCLANAKQFGVLDDPILRDAKAVYVPTRKLFDHYYTHFFFADVQLGRQVMHAVRQHVRLVDEAFVHAARVVAKLPEHFNSIHVRRNDFQYKDIRFLPVATIIRNTRQALPPSEPLYIATDEHDPNFLSEWRALYTPARIYSLDANFTDVLRDTPKRWLGIVEMLIASQGDMFIGSRLSTFSGYITRLRGYMGKAYQETHFTGDDSAAWALEEREQGIERHRVGNKLPLWKNGWDWSTWGREFAESWDQEIQVWNPKTIEEKGQKDPKDTYTVQQPGGGYVRLRYTKAPSP